MMEGMGGLEFLKRAKSSERLKDIPFIIISAKASSQDLREGMNLGADDYLFKPFKLSDLDKTMQRLLEKKESSTKDLIKVKKRLNIEKKKREKLEYYSSHIVRKHISNAQGIIELLISQYPKEDLLTYLKDEIEALNDISISQINPETSHDSILKKPNNILLVDDDEVALFYNKRMVELFIKPQILETISDPRKVLPYLQSSNKKIDLIILDLNMPNLNGMEVLNQLKEENLLHPTIILSYDLSSIRQKDLSVFDVLEVWTKPVTEEQINSFLESINA